MPPQRPVRQPSREPEHKPALELGSISRILEMTPKEPEFAEVDIGKLYEQQELKNPANKGKAAGEVAVERGWVSQENLDLALMEQARLKAIAAAKDLAKIYNNGKQHSLDTTDKYKRKLVPYWGNNTVNNAQTGMPAGASAAANMGADIALLVNEKPEMLKDEGTRKTIGDGVKAAAALTRFISGDPAVRLSEKQAIAFQEQLEEGLRVAVEKSGHQPKDRNKKPVEIEDYLEERRSEVMDGVVARAKVMKIGEDLQNAVPDAGAGTPGENVKGKAQGGPHGSKKTENSR